MRGGGQRPRRRGAPVACGAATRARAGRGLAPTRLVPITAAIALSNRSGASTVALPTAGLAPGASVRAAFVQVQLSGAGSVSLGAPGAATATISNSSVSASAVGSGLAATRGGRLPVRISGHLRAIRAYVVAELVSTARRRHPASGDRRRRRHPARAPHRPRAHQSRVPPGRRAPRLARRARHAHRLTARPRAAAGRGRPGHGRRDGPGAHGPAAGQRRPYSPARQRGRAGAPGDPAPGLRGPRPSQFGRGADRPARAAGRRAGARQDDGRRRRTPRPPHGRAPTPRPPAR